MNRPSTIVGLAAVTLALMVGCGKESKSGSPCRDEYVKLYEKALKLLKDASPSDPDIDDRMRNVLGGGVPKACTDPRLANDILEQVAREFGPQLAALEGKWGSDNISGFRDPLGAGHGDPIQHEPPGSSPQPATPVRTTQP
jgi:hypothetical protein